MKKKELAILIDISTFAYRSLYSKHDNDSEHPVAKKTLRYLLNIINEFSPDYLAISFDSDRDKIYRRTILPEYKADRSDRPKEITEGLKIVKEFCNMFNILVLEDEFNESDDHIASAVKQFEKSKVFSVVASADGDLTQLFSKYTKIGKPTRTSIKVLRTWSQIQSNFKKIQVDSPDKVRDYLSLQGDKSDNIPNVPKIGAKRALDLIEKYGDIRTMYNSDDKLLWNLREYEDMVFKNRNLVKLYNKIPMPDLEEFRYGSFNYDKALKWMEEHGLSNKLFNEIIDLDF